MRAASSVVSGKSPSQPKFSFYPVVKCRIERNTIGPVTAYRTIITINNIDAGVGAYSFWKYFLRINSLQ